MATPGPSELISTTQRNRRGKAADNVTKNIALLIELSKKGNIDMFDGGRSLFEELDFQVNSTAMWYTGNENLNVSASDVISAAEYEIKQAAVAVVMNGLEEIQNSGKYATIKWAAARIKNAERSIKNLVHDGLYSDGTGFSGKQVTGLQAAIPDNPATGTYGGIDRATWNFWRSQLVDSSTEFGANISSANIQRALNKLSLRCTRGSDGPKAHFCDNNFFEAYWESLTAIQRINEPETGDGGYRKLKYRGAPVYCDGGYQGPAGTGGCPANHWYMIDTNYLKWRPYKGRNFVPLSKRESVNQDAFVQFIAFAGNLTSSCSFLNGVLIN